MTSSNPNYKPNPKGPTFKYQNIGCYGFSIKNLVEEGDTNI